MDCCKTEETIRETAMHGNPLIRLDDVSKVYQLESGDFTALNHITLDINEGEFVALMGPSGSGKSTMMNQLGMRSISPGRMWPV
jgi:putative ABC transport system ATP-binding protein